MNKTLIINFSLYFLIYFAQKAFILAICTMVNQVTNNNKLIIMGECSYVLTTHTDKGHVHNHLIFCSADDITFSHYYDCKRITGKYEISATLYARNITCPQLCQMVKRE